jgi:GNAT superfamily N-acetyltransferase
VSASPPPPGTVRLRAARPGEAALLSALALRSKASWGYDEAFIDACRAELTYTPSRLRDPLFHFVVAIDDGDLCGFYALETRAPQRFELDALFVAPDRIGTGIGRALIGHAIAAVRQAGGRSLVIQGDPNAAGFYHAAGARRIGSRSSGSIEGRELPLFEITIEH